VTELPRFKIPDGYAPAFAPALAATADFRFGIPVSRPSRWMLKLIVALGALNLIAFVAFSIHLGGTALHGEIAGGHYYVAMLGSQTEVSREAFSYSLLDTLLTFITTGAALIAWIILHLTDSSHRDSSFS
jgi:hypothetical protein